MVDSSRRRLREKCRQGDLTTSFVDNGNLVHDGVEVEGRAVMVLKPRPLKDIF